MATDYKITLIAELEALKSKLTNKKFGRLYHLRSVENFIYHIDDISSTKDRERIYNHLISYFGIVDQYPQPIDIRDSLVLFNEYLRPVGEYYSDNYGFWVFVKPWIIIIWVCIALLMIILLSLSPLIYIFISMVIAGYLGYIANKFLQKKVYSFLW